MGEFTKTVQTIFKQAQANLLQERHKPNGTINRDFYCGGWSNYYYTFTNKSLTLPYVLLVGDRATQGPS